MEFRSFSDLTDLVRDRVHEIPGDVELVVGVPRSGMLPASLIALILNRPLQDLESFLRGETATSGTTRPILQLGSVESVGRVLVVEDSISSGRSIEAVKSRVSARYPDLKPIYLAVYAAPHTKHFVDIHFDTCPHPRAFEWNLLNSWVCAEGAFDLDGVFCADPSDADNDDGPNYRRFLASAQQIRLPGQRLHRIVTSRLEKYRSETEDWLGRAGISYDHLDMLNGVTAEERREKRLHAPFKASVYAGDQSAKLFVESDPVQAAEIAKLSGKPVVDFKNMILAGPDAVSVPFAMRQGETIARRLRARLRKTAARLVGR